MCHSQTITFPEYWRRYTDTLSSRPTTVHLPTLNAKYLWPKLERESNLFKKAHVARATAQQASLPSYSISSNILILLRWSCWSLSAFWRSPCRAEKLTSLQRRFNVVGWQAPRNASETRRDASRSCSASLSWPLACLMEPLKLNKRESK